MKTLGIYGSSAHAHANAVASTNGGPHGGPHWSNGGQNFRKGGVY